MKQISFLETVRSGGELVKLPNIKIKIPAQKWAAFKTYAKVRGWSLWGLGAALAADLYLVYVFVKHMACDSGVFGCGWDGFSLVSPVYIFLSQFGIRLGAGLFTFLFLVCTVMYTAAVYYVGKTLDEKLTGAKVSPNFFTLKKI